MILIGGPCVIESEELVEEVASVMGQITEKYAIDYYFKASFDKANRTSISSYRGPGLEKGLDILRRVKEKYHVKIATDIHEPYQAAKVAEVADIIQIPAFLCRQTDLLIAAAKTGKIINIKKAQFLAPWDMKYVLGKVKEAGGKTIYLCERGTSFGYNNLVVDMTGIYEMKKFGYPVIFDGTHSVQKPGGNGSSTGGNREYVRLLVRAAMSLGIDGIFLEMHPKPEKALSDGPNMVRLSEVEGLLSEVLQIEALVKSFGD